MREFFDTIQNSVVSFINAYDDLWKLLTSQTTLGQFTSENLPENLTWLGTIAEAVLNFSISDLLWYSVGLYISFVLIKWVVDVVT